MRLLIVEDEQALRRNLVEGLRREGYAVDEVEDGEDALIQALEVDYDGIVLDVLLPGIDGWEVLRRIRARKKTPVLMLTALDDVGNRVRGLDGGADDFLGKPFHFDELRSRLRALIRRSSGHATEKLGVGDLELDTRTRRVLKAGVPIPVTRMEFRILEQLAADPGRVLSREQLYEHLYNDEDDSLGNSLYVHISNLRRKLGKGIIRTVSGQGYALEAE